VILPGQKPRVASNLAAESEPAAKREKRGFGEKSGSELYIDLSLVVRNLQRSIIDFRKWRQNLSNRLKP
jgi:hypothetical protein